MKLPAAPLAGFPFHSNKLRGIQAKVIKLFDNFFLRSRFKSSSELFLRLFPESVLGWGAYRVNAFESQ
jgi:hypothetical protein